MSLGCILKWKSKAINVLRYMLCLVLFCQQSIRRLFQIKYKPILFEGSIILHVGLQQVMMRFRSGRDLCIWVQVVHRDEQYSMLIKNYCLLFVCGMMKTCKHISVAWF